jgi:hypothetical protein
MLLLEGKERESRLREKPSCCGCGSGNMRVRQTYVYIQLRMIVSEILTESTDIFRAKLKGPPLVDIRTPSPPVYA